MKIDRSTPKPGIQAYRTSVPPVASRSGAERAGNAPRQSDVVSVSSEAEGAMRLRKALRKAPEVRLDLVERLKAQVEAGTYHVEPRAVAEKILKSKVLDQ